MTFMRAYPNLVGVVWLTCAVFVAISMLAFVGRAWALALGGGGALITVLDAAALFAALS